jgi:hypothetical protein
MKSDILVAKTPSRRRAREIEEYMVGLYWSGSCGHVTCICGLHSCIPEEEPLAEYNTADTEPLISVIRGNSFIIYVTTRFSSVFTLYALILGPGEEVICTHLFGNFFKLLCYRAFPFPSTPSHYIHTNNDNHVTAFCNNKDFRLPSVGQADLRRTQSYIEHREPRDSSNVAMNCAVVMRTDGSEERITSIFRIQSQPSNKPARSRRLRVILPNIETARPYISEDGNIHNYKEWRLLGCYGVWFL